MVEVRRDTAEPRLARIGPNATLEVLVGISLRGADQFGTEYRLVAILASSLGELGSGSSCSLCQQLWGYLLMVVRIDSAEQIDLTSMSKGAQKHGSSLYSLK